MYVKLKLIKREGRPKEISETTSQHQEIRRRRFAHFIGTVTENAIMKDNLTVYKP